ncbi:MAG: hypothetical protein RIB53_00945 [Roseitalea porphyridii]|jgi:predicted transcriptional regulator|uniref:hypothetical protein n=1 Tax=Roseitalea porphyridii TaxID=1852022 RepID=UPI0032EA95AE
MTNNSLEQIEQQKLVQLQGIHYQLSRIADILAHKHGEPAFVNTVDVERQIAAVASERRQ